MIPEVSSVNRLRPSVMATAISLLVVADAGLAQCQLDRESFTNAGVFGTFVPGDPLAVSADASTLVVTAENDDDIAQSSGAVHVLVRNGDDWQVEAKLTAPDGRLNDQFGRAAALSSDGDTLLVGAWLTNDDGSNAGSAYVFERDGSEWRPATKLGAAEAEANDHFGISVALSASGDLALVGAPDTSIGNDTGGAAYVFSRDAGAWAERGALRAPEPEEGDRFGDSVDLSDDGTIALVGADGASLAYVFTSDEPDSWTLVQQLESGGFPAAFGFAVSLSGDGRTAAVGAPVTFHDEGVGSVFVFRREESEFELEVELRDPESSIESSFGFGLDLTADGGKLLVGQVLTLDGDSPGSAFVFTRTNGVWTHTQALHADDPTDLSTYGNRLVVSADGEIAVVGSQIGVDPRVVHIYSLSELCPVLVQLAPNPGRAGQLNSLSATWPIAGERIAFLGARSAGATPVPGCPGLSVDLDTPVLLGEGVVSDRGGVMIEIDIPLGLLGERVQLQAVALDSCAVSLAIEEIL